MLSQTYRVTDLEFEYKRRIASARESSAAQKRGVDGHHRALPTAKEFSARVLQLCLINVHCLGLREKMFEKDPTVARLRLLLEISEREERREVDT